MLVLSRKPRECVILRNTLTGETMKVTAVALRPSAMRIGFDAASEWVIVREELVYPKQPITDILKTVTCPDDSEIADLGLRPTDEAANGFVPVGCEVIADEV